MNISTESAQGTFTTEAPRWNSSPLRETMHFTVSDCSLGLILVAKSSIGICAIFLGDDSEILIDNLRDRFPAANLIGGDADFEETVSDVIVFIENPDHKLHLPLDLRGTAFQQRVWQALQEIPLGETASYTDIARSIGSPKAVRAVAQACGANPVAVVVPCHRVLRNDGALSGYRWGVERKRLLLTKEGVRLRT